MIACRFLNNDNNENAQTVGSGLLYWWRMRNRSAGKTTTATGQPLIRNCSSNPLVVCEFKADFLPKARASQDCLSGPGDYLSSLGAGVAATAECHLDLVSASIVPTANKAKLPAITHNPSGID
jgi:hypothetical protein